MSKEKGRNEPLTVEELEKKALQQRLESEKKEVAVIEYNKFPTVLGWYFDGCFIQNYSLNEEYAEFFTEIEEEREAIRDFELAETFTEMAARNFWPPKYYGGFFRTRGVYLDLPELKEDPPKTPPEMNFEKQKITIGNNNDGDAGDLADRLKNWPTEEDPKANLKDNWYWDEDKDDFLPKVPEHEYYFDDFDKVYKQKIDTDSIPYDWYFDDHDGQFFRRDRTRPQDYIFDHGNTVFKKKGRKGPSVNDMTPADYLFDENDKRWHPRNFDDERGTEFYPQGRRKIRKGPRGKSNKTLDDYYYDPKTGMMCPKDVNNEKSYKFDPNDEMWKKVGDPYHTKDAEFYPQDYCFDKEDGTWKPKRPLEQKKISPYDFYFDDDLGRFYPRDKNQRELYDFDHKLNIWKLKSATGPSANQLTNMDYYFDEDAFTWKLNISAPDQEKLDYHNAGRRKVLVGDRGRTGKTDDDYYYDASEGKFLPKTDKISDYYYDTEAEIFRKLGQPMNPSGSNKRGFKEYYFDPQDGLWLPTNAALSAPKAQPKIRTRPDLSAYDYAFNDFSGVFELRNLSTPENYTYKPETAVYHKNGTKGPSINGKLPEHYYFDEVDGRWHLKLTENGGKANQYPNGRRKNRLGPRGLTGLIADDMYFDTMEGKFFEKDKENPEQYEFDPKEGVWKIKGCEPGPGKNKLASVHYYWDDEMGEFLLKEKLTTGELFKDRNTNVWKIRRRRPKDYFWDTYPGKYQRKQGRFVIGDDGKKKVDRALILKEAQKNALELDEEDDDDDSDDGHRNDEYNKPWLHNFPHLAADKFRLETEKKRMDEMQAKKKDAKEQKEKEAAEKREREAKEKKAVKEKRKLQKKMQANNSPVSGASPATSKEKTDTSKKTASKH